MVVDELIDDSCGYSIKGRGVARGGIGEQEHKELKGNLISSVSCL